MSTADNLDLGLMGVYLQASDRWNEFKISQEPMALKDTAGILCEGLNYLTVGDGFWDAFAALAARAEHQRDSVKALLEDFEALMVIEEQVLLSLRVNGVRINGVDAVRLIEDMSRALRVVDQLPNLDTIRYLQRQAEALQSSLCSAWEEFDVQNANTQSSPEGRRGFFRAVRLVGKAILVTGGGVFVTVNHLVPENLPIPSSALIGIALDIGAVKGASGAIGQAMMSAGNIIPGG